jgi:hypothetical protein
MPTRTPSEFPCPVCENESVIPPWETVRRMIVKHRGQYSATGYRDLCEHVGITPQTMDGYLYRHFMPGWDRGRRIYLYFLTQPKPQAKPIEEPKPQLCYTRP